MFSGRVKIRLSKYNIFKSIMLILFGVWLLYTTIWLVGTALGFGMSGYDVFFDGMKPVCVISESMEPIIDTNAIVLVENTSYSDIVVGDIISFHTREYGDVTHRVVEIVDTGYITKGDNNDGVDTWVVNEGMYVGKVSKIWNIVAPSMTFLFGDFTEITAGRLLVGLCVLALLLGGVCYVIVYLLNDLFIYIFIWYSIRNKEYIKEYLDGYSTGSIEKALDVVEMKDMLKLHKAIMRSIKGNSVIENIIERGKK